MGMTGTLGTSSSMRPTGVPSHQLRPSQPSLRPPQTATSSQPPSSQNFQGHGMLRVSTLGSPASPSPSSSQSPQTQTQGQTQTQTQPWLSSGTQGRPPIPSPSPRPQPSSQPFQQRSHVPLQNHPNIPTNQQQPISSGQQSLQSSGSGSGSGQPMELYRPVNGAPRSITHQQQMANQQQITRGAGLASQRPPLGLTQSGGGSQLGAPSKTVNADAEESSSRIISKRSIQELVNQVKMFALFSSFVDSVDYLGSLIIPVLWLFPCKIENYLQLACVNFVTFLVWGLLVLSVALIFVIYCVHVNVRNFKPFVLCWVF
ncbi:PREDICTED: transcription initiation factor TFIID subunit 12-like [Erythranthe guttata]|uniref:transcription initiation factor TFIID subunit 12-like n=1 Tax=Erythranthe guttata TaxID=4155 RepID=UPI00064DF867|nr:PREDICTED: transcription initiation factor TFIID subunit 12-like [Erythranthe guttata]|eukprot:XP_012839676.1 PREDICTED: transcription initiation factor TFIID subunit 12-like [Erythranthe guttata]